MNTWRGLIVVGFTFGAMMLASLAPSPRLAYATDPTLDAAIYQATVRAGQTAVSARQTTDARAQDEANARATTNAINNAVLSQNATATAQAQARDAQATQVARTATAQFVQTQDAERATAQAQATQVAQATRTAQAQATATASALAAQQTAAAGTATAVMDGLNVSATRTAHQIQLSAEERDANVRSGFLVFGGIIALLMLVVGGTVGIRWLWYLTRIPLASVPSTSPAASPLELENDSDYIDVTPRVEPIAATADLEMPPFQTRPPKDMPETITQIALADDESTANQAPSIALRMIMDSGQLHVDTGPAPN